jgi:glutathione S-transferase
MEQQMSRPIVHGVEGSPFVNAVRIGLEEKGVPYEFADMPLGAHKQPTYLALNPFGRIPAMEHDGFVVYETQAILRYVDRAFSGPALQPTDVRQLARMDQIMNIHDWYMTPSITAGISFHRCVASLMGLVPDEEKIAAALPQSRTCLSELARLMGHAPYLAGDSLSLADIIVSAPFAYFTTTPEARELMAPHPALAAWWTRIAGRGSLQRVRPRTRPFVPQHAMAS